MVSEKKEVTCLYLLISMSFSVSSYIQSISVQLGVYPVWLVVSTPLKHISQLGFLFPMEKNQNVPNHHFIHFDLRPALVSKAVL